MAELELDRITKVYDNGFTAVSDLSLTIADGEFLVLVGPSGCGKTTALRMVAGLEEISSGELRIAGKVVNNLQPRERDIAMVFQSYALYPHMSVAENIGFGLKLQKLPKQEIERRVRDAARLLGLEDLLDRRPKMLSGGQRQRVAMGRAIVRQPQAFLMDEPLSNLDAKLRVQMRADIAKLQRDLGVTTMYVTHDQVEAMTMGDRVAVMRRGVLQQVAPPQELYDHPANLFVAGFIGSPPMNMAEATVQVEHDGVFVQIGSQRLRVGEANVAARPALASYDRRVVAVGVRPEDLEDVAAVAAEVPADRQLSAPVSLTEALGSHLVIHANLDAAPVSTDEAKELSADRGGQGLPVIGPGAGTVFVASFSPRSHVKVGETVRIAVDTDRLYFFDLDTGLAITQ